jgi:predicted TPR repeat methyltransferase
MVLPDNSEETELGRLVSERPDAIAVRIRYAQTVAHRNRGEAVSTLLDGAFYADVWGLNDLAASLLSLDAIPDAIRLYQQAVRQLPQNPAAFAGLAHAWGALGEKAKADAMAARASDLGWQDDFPVFGDGPTRQGTRHLFDQYAQRFDAHLVETLAYTLPKKLLALIDRAFSSGKTFESVLDIGCGTGLMGALLRQRAVKLTGIDLSPAMVREAAKKSLYDRLESGDAMTWLQHSIGAFDLIVAADVLTYVGALPPFLSAIAAGLRPGGICALSIETHAGAGTVLLPSRRYAHAATWCLEAAQLAGLAVLVQEIASPRIDQGLPVPGLNLVLQKTLLLSNVRGLDKAQRSQAYPEKDGRARQATH